MKRLALFSPHPLWWIVPSVVGVLGVVAGIWLLYRSFEDRFYSGIVIDQVDVSGMTRAEAENELRKQNTFPLGQDATIKLSAEKGSIASTSAELGFQHSYVSALDQAYAIGRTGSIFEKIGQSFPRIIGLPTGQQALTSDVSFDQEKVTAFVTSLKSQLDEPGVQPSITLGITGSANSLKVEPGKVGRTLNLEQTVTAVMNHADEVNSRIGDPSKFIEVTAKVIDNNLQLTDEQVVQFKDRAKKLVGKKALFRADNVLEILSDQKMISLLAFPDQFSDTAVSTVLASWQKEVNRPAQDAVLKYNPDTLVVETFIAPRKGLVLNYDQTKTDLVAVLKNLENTDQKEQEITLAVAETQPSVPLSATNNLGINERIGFGESEYFHSIPGRIHNVALTAKKVNNTIVKAGEEFSFNKTLGDVSATTGFQPAYIIRNGRTELGDGGGVCQVSTTLFRSVLNAGLPVTKRKAHSYRVSYYELNAKPGIDATVYAGEVDLRFINDTGHAILIHTFADSAKLYMNVEIYGTSDGRTTEIVDHKVYDFKPAPAPLYQDDPSIPKGKLKQVDFAASGVKANFKNIIKNKAGEVIRTEEYFSNYVPWRAVFLRGV